jgi:hypothetical protein
MNKSSRIVAVGLSLSAAAFAPAQVTGYDFFRSQFFTQTANNIAPVTPDTYQINARVFSSTYYDPSLGDFAQTNGSGGVLNDLGPYNGSYSYSGGYEVNYIDNAFTSQSSEETSFPQGFYQYTLSDGSTATVSVPSTAFADAVPYFTGNTFNSLQNANVANSLNVSWNTISNSTDQNAQLAVFFDVFDFTTGSFVYSNFSDGSYTGDSIAAGTLTAGDSYQASLFFSSRYYNMDPNATGAFTGVGNLVGFDYATSINFQTQAVPEPVSLVALSLGSLVLLRRKRN